MAKYNVRVITGAQWGDEGKGKVTHFMAKKADAVARFAGGCNAGHTIIFDGRKYKLHHLPSGIFMENCINILGNGMVIDPIILDGEITSLEQSGFSAKNLKISDRAHIIMPYHRCIDSKQETNRQGSKLGTTGRGIGPVYTDKASRTGIRAADLLDPVLLKEKIEFHLREKSALLSESGLTADSILEQILPIAAKLKPGITDTSLILHNLMKEGKNILLEGAQGALLDIDFGTYPYVTSSSAISGGAPSGTGLPPWSISTIVGIVKAYTTRIGTGPFPTELADDTGKRLLETGAEYGTTTGRPRRCGWLDLPLLAFASRINGLTDIALTKLDVLTGINPLKIAVKYKIDGIETDNFPADSRMVDKCEPVYAQLEGWQEDISGCKSKSELPENARKYIEFIEKNLEIPVSLISVGADHDQTIIVHPEKILF